MLSGADAIAFVVTRIEYVYGGTSNISDTKKFGDLLIHGKVGSGNDIAGNTCRSNRQLGQRRHGDGHITAAIRNCHGAEIGSEASRFPRCFVGVVCSSGIVVNNFDEDHALVAIGNCDDILAIRRIQVALGEEVAVLVVDIDFVRCVEGARHGRYRQGVAGCHRSGGSGPAACQSGDTDGTGSDSDSDHTQTSRRSDGSHL